MGPKYYFIICYRNVDEVGKRWVVGSALKESYEEIMELYKELSNNNICQICQTIYG